MTVNDTILDQCLADIRAKRATVADCLARYPDGADELKPLLEMAAALEDVPDVQPAAAFKQATRARLLRLQPPANIRARNRTAWFSLGGSLRYAAAAIVIVLLFATFSGGVAYAASNSLPGSALYPVKRAVEQVELAMATTPESQAQVHMALADQRLNEAAALAKSGQQQLAEQAVKEYSAQVDAALAVLPTSPSGASASTARELAKSLSRQQEELRAIQVPASMKKTVEDAIGVSKRAMEHFSTQPTAAPAEHPTTKPKPADTATPPAVAPPQATETPRGSDQEHGKQTPQAPELPLQPTLTVPVPTFTPVPTITLSIPVLPGPKKTLPVPLPDVGNSHKDGK